MLIIKPAIKFFDDVNLAELREERIYIASPFSHPDKGVEEQRYNDAVEALHLCLRHGLVAFSPIVHSYVVARRGDLSGDFPTWERPCISFLANWATEVWVLKIPGWNESRGIAAELNFCRGSRMVYHRRDLYIA